MKYLGEVSVIIGIKTTRSEQGIPLDQSQYMEKILKKDNYFVCKHVSRYMILVLNYLKTQLKFLDKLSMRASLAVICMSLVVLDPTLNMS